MGKDVKGRGGGLGRLRGGSVGAPPAEVWTGDEEGEAEEDEEEEEGVCEGELRLMSTYSPLCLWKRFARPVKHNIA